MKIGTTTLVLGVALTVVAGLFSSTIFGLIGTSDNAKASTATSALITGHVTTEVRDALGNIKEYRQSDNTIVNGGENCVGKLLFGAAGGDTVTTGTCTGEFNAGFRFIGIGNYTTNVNGTNTALGQEYRSSVPSLARTAVGAASVTMSNSTGATGSTSQQTVTLSDTWTCTHCSNGLIVRESGLFNSTNVNNSYMFARQTFSSITLNNNDSLTVTWTVNIGGTTGSLANP